MVYAVLALLAVVSCIHLYGCSQPQPSKFRVFTKPVLVPLIAVLYCLLTAHIRPTVLLALFFCLLGDVFLLFKKKTFFTIGSSCFAAGHAFFMISYLTDMQGIPSGLSIAITVALYAAVYALFIRLLCRYVSVKSGLPCFCYIAVVMLMSLCACIRMLSGVSGSIITFVGSLIFVISDLLIVYSMYVNRSFKNGVLVMLTYIAAQLLIVIGLAGGFQRF